MRQVLDQNPVARIALIAILALAMLFVFYSRVLHSQSESTTTPATPAASSGQSASKPKPAIKPATGSSQQQSHPAPVYAQLTPARGLPASVANAYNHGKIVVLVVTQRGAVVDDVVRAGARRLRARKNVALFQISSSKVDAYARLIQGAKIDRLPALVVIAPHQKSLPLQVVVRQGFVDAAGMVQAVDDAVYKGATIAPYPN